MYETSTMRFKGGAPCRVTTSKGPVVSCASIVVATNSPVNDWVAIHTKQAAYRTYVIGLRVPRGSVTKALYWDTSDPFHYVRLQKELKHEVLLVGGEDHKTGQADDAEERFGRLEAWTRERFPMAGETEFRWSGQIMEPVDSLAFIGRNPGDKDIYVVPKEQYFVLGDNWYNAYDSRYWGYVSRSAVIGKVVKIYWPWNRMSTPRSLPGRDVPWRPRLA